MGDEIKRREFIKAAAFFGGGVAAGEYLDDDGQNEFVGGGGGPAAPRLHIHSGEVATVSVLKWYSSIVWEEQGSLELDEGESIGLLEA